MYSSDFNSPLSDDSRELSGDVITADGFSRTFSTIGSSGASRRLSSLSKRPPFCSMRLFLHHTHQKEFQPSERMDSLEENGVGKRSAERVGLILSSDARFTR
ncbi:hypothetical protein EYF80_033642 [Liparis tanakae]|uniref:Uncharacterized protein n=1 Tax=Liparis tanakae TaxID=230148 RepID=A0A4Z2GRH8_9TELE|nr:hypothetical protein EYF80_033642 [Liparis tanakae]